MNTLTLSPTESEPCPKCGSHDLKRQTGDDEPTCHYGRLICNTCGRFITWLKDPSATLSHMNRKQAIDSMLNSQSINQWERTFLQNIYEVRVLIGKQQSKYEQIYKRLSPVVNTIGDKESADCWDMG